MPNRLGEYLIKFMGDGQPHYEVELAQRMLETVPPERAARGYKSVLKDGTTPPIEHKIRVGIRSITHSALTALEKKGLIAREPSDGPPAWRLIDKHELEWARVLREAMQRHGPSS